MNTITIKSKIWFEIDSQPVLSHGSVMLLKKIETTGSLRSAAIELNMSYQKARKLMAYCNENGQQKVLITKTGGLSGGGTTLTDYGKKMIKLYDEIVILNQNYLKEQFKKLQNES